MSSEEPTIEHVISAVLVIVAPVRPTDLPTKAPSQYALVSS